MLRNTKIFILSALMLISTSCKKTLELDYGSMRPMLVVEGYVTNEDVRVSVQRTTDMTDSVRQASLPTAAVFLSGSDGYDEQLTLAPDGYFRSPSGATGHSGVTYSLRVVQSDTLCTAQSTMPTAVEIDSVRFSWMHIMADVDIRTCYVYFSDPYPEDNYYQIITHRGNQWFNSGYANDVPLENLPPHHFMLALMSRNESEDAEEKRANGEDVEKPEEIIFVGDTVEFELRTIDWPQYNYLRTLDQNTSSAVNPISNIHGDGCLGLFGAFHTSRHQCVYSND